jgi:predicted  nucleic acid-binding Zn-ribbon protein
MDPAASARFRPAEPASHPPSALPPYAGARDDAVALLRLAGLDAQIDRLRQSTAALLEPLERLRSDLEALADLVESDRPREATRESGEAREARRRRLLSNQSMHTELAEALKRDEENVFAMSSELQRKTAGVAQEREAALACFPSPLRERYEASVRNGQEPALVALHDGRCPGCSQTLPEASRRLVEENLLVVPCSGCHRLLCDRGWTERDFMPARLRSVPGARP